MTEFKESLVDEILAGLLKLKQNREIILPSHPSRIPERGVTTIYMDKLLYKTFSKYTKLTGKKVYEVIEEALLEYMNNHLVSSELR